MLAENLEFAEAQGDLSHFTCWWLLPDPDAPSILDGGTAIQRNNAFMFLGILDMMTDEYFFYVLVHVPPPE